MFSIQLFLSTLLCICTFSSPIYGPLVTNLGAPTTYFQLSADSSTLVASFKNSKDVEVYQNNGEGYSFKESINDTLSS